LSHKPGGRLPLLSARSAVTLAALKTASQLRLELSPFCAQVQHANHSSTEPPWTTKLVHKKLIKANQQIMKYLSARAFLVSSIVVLVQHDTRDAIVPADVSLSLPTCHRTDVHGQPSLADLRRQSPTLSARQS